MSKSVAAMLTLLFMAALCIVAVKPAFSSAGVTENTWVLNAPMHEARSGLGVAVVNGKIYAIGGSTVTYASLTGPSQTGGIIGTNEEYDPVTDTWTFKTPMPTPNSGFVTAVCQNKIYCIGSTTQVYDPTTDTWENKTSMPTVRTGLKANVANGKIYLIGGYVPGRYTVENLSSSFLTLNEVYDPATDTWTTEAPMPFATARYVSAVVDNKIYIIGKPGGSSIDPPLGVPTQVYDTETGTWSQATRAPTFGLYVAVATTGVMAPKRIYALGLENLVYDPETDDWSTVARIPTKRYLFGAAVVDDMIYVVGGMVEAKHDLLGYTYTKFATNERYTPFGYGTVPPAVSVVSPENGNYTSGDVSLAFTVNKPVVWLGYSLDGQDNVTVAGNATISGLANGLHNVTVYAEDEFGNVGASETVLFTIAEPEPFPTTLVATASAATIAVVGAVLLVYFKKRKQ
jgi:N-acetylneuraminic acid mutarotase